MIRSGSRVKMPQPQGSLIQNLRRVADLPGDGMLLDAQLLERWVNHRDEAAFELLLRRHGPMVLSAARRLVGDADAAQDAVQATWLVFLRHARNIRKRDSLPAWLHRVACRVALRMRASTIRRQKRERADTETLTHAAAIPETKDDPGLQTIMDEEINRLPRHHRWALIVCVLQGKSYAEAAHELGRPQGTIASWAARARERLRVSLSRRGVALGVGTLSVGIGEELSASLPAPLVTSLVNAAKANVATGEAHSVGVSPRAAALAHEVGKIMLISKIKIAVLVMLFVILAATGAFALPVPPSPEEPLKPSPALPTAALRPDPPTKPSTGLPAPAPHLAPVAPRPVATLERTLKLTGPVESIAFSPDGKTVACGGLLGVQLFDTGTGEEKPAPKPGEKLTFVFSGQVQSLAFSPDGKLLATAGFGDKATLWDVETGEERLTLKGDFVTAVVFSSDGRTVATANARVVDKRIFGEVKLWEVRTGELQRTLKWDGAQMWCLAFAKDGNTIAAGGLAGGTRDEMARLWNPNTGEEKKTLKRTGGELPAALPFEAFCVAFAPDGKSLALGGNNSSLCVVDAESFKVTRSLTGPRDGHNGSPRSVAFTSNGQILLSSGTDGSAKLWDAQSGKLFQTMEGKQGSTAAALSFDGRMLATGGDTTVKLWKLEMVKGDK
jgi:RNA polymerase sigma factor (sigma-70 family)